MGKDGPRHRPGKGDKEKPSKPVAKEDDDGDISPHLEDDSNYEEETGGSQDESSPKPAKRRPGGRKQQGEQKSNALVTAIAIVVVLGLVGITLRQRYQAEQQHARRAASDAADDIPNMDDLYDSAEDENEQEREPDRARQETTADKKKRKEPQEAYNYDDPDAADEYGDEEDDDADEGMSPDGTDTDDDIKDMMPTEPMEDDGEEGDGGDRHLESPDDGHDKYADGGNSLMRPHESIKVNFWNAIKSKLAARQGKELHPSGDIVQVDDVLTTAECLQLIKHHEELVADHENPPPWCFESESWINKALDEEQVGEQTETFQINQSGAKNMFCAKSQEVHDRLGNRYPYSTATLISRGEHDVVDAVERKLEEEIGLPKDNAYHTQLVKYRSGEKYYPHVDCDPGKTPKSPNRNDRLATIIIYLSDVKKGGETSFPQLGVRVKPKRGSAIVFKNLDADSKCNMEMIHRGDAPLSGVKYIYQHWYHETIILPSYMQNVVLCDNSDSCREYIHAKPTRRASELVRKGDMARPNVKKSADFYKKALEIQPNHAQALLYLADSLAQLKQDREALKYFEKHLRIHPKSIDGNFVAAGIWQDLGRRSKAIELLQRVVAVSPRDADALFNLATLFAEEGHKKKAVTALKSMVQFSPKDHGAHSFLAELLTELGDDEGAAKHQALAGKHKSRTRE